MNQRGNRGIKSIEISGYKGLESVTLKNIFPVNYLVGKNASGKSSVLESIKIFSDALTGYISSPVVIPGFTKYAIKNDLKINIIFTDNLFVECNVPLSTPIDNNSFFVNPDAIKISSYDLVSIKDSNPREESRLRSEVFSNYTGFSFISRYISSFTEKVDNEDYVIRPEHLSFNFNNIDTVSEVDLESFLNKYYPLLKNEKVDDISSSIRADKAVQFQISDKSTNAHLYKVGFTQISGGLRSITRLYFGLKRIINEILTRDDILAIISIEEPENGFHPELQKQIPSILHDFTGSHQNLIFMITTHSPFIVSSAINYKEQKVYLFNKGSLTNLAQDPVSESEGYHSEKCLNVVASMLGSGFSDLSAVPNTHEKIRIVYCEGGAKDIKDSEIYRKIFQDQTTIFVSSGGFQEALTAFHLARTGAKFIFGNNTEVCALVDRSYSSGDIKVGPGKDDFIRKTSSKKIIFTEAERCKFLASEESKNLKMLKRKEIENYIFDPSVVTLLSTNQSSQVKISKDAIDYETGEVKDFVGAPAEIKLHLAELIFKHRASKTKSIYQELLSCLN